MTRSSVDAKIKILFLAANPRGTARLTLDEETRQIRDKIRQAEHRDAFVFETRLAARPDDLTLALLEVRPHVLHISGHGEDAAILFQDDSGHVQHVAGTALARLLRDLKDNLRVVLLNACYTREQAEGITEHIDCAIGMRRPIRDDAAIRFAASFYRNLGFGLSVKKAFDVARTTIELEGIPGEDVPELLVRPGVDAERIVLIDAAAPPREPTTAPADARSIPPEPEHRPALASAAEPRRRGATTPLWRIAAGLGLGVAAMAALGVAAYCAGPGQERVQPRLDAAPPASAVVAIEPFPEGVDIAVIAPPEAEREAAALCKQVHESGVAQVRCVARVVPGAGSPAAGEALDGRLADAAKTAGAVLLVTLASDGTARLAAPAAPEIGALLQGMQTVSASRKGLAPSLRALVVLERRKMIPMLDPDQCPRLAPGSIDRLSLLLSLLVPSCAPERFEPGWLNELCGSRDQAPDVSCALARLLSAERSATTQEARDELTQMLGRTPARFQVVAGIKLLRSACERGNIEWLSRGIEDFAKGKTSCDQVAVAPIAACLLAKAPSTAGVSVSDAVRTLEARPLQQLGCDQQQLVARALGERADWRGRAGRWREAVEDYQEAYSLGKELRHALLLAEALLHEKHPDEALRRLDETRDATPGNATDRIYRGLLRWVATRELKKSERELAGEAKDLVSEYSKLDARVAPLSPPEEDPALRALVCPDNRRAPCAYDVLGSPKRDDSVEELERGLGLTGGK